MHHSTSRTLFSKGEFWAMRYVRSAAGTTRCTTDGRSDGRRARTFSWAPMYGNIITW
jgi:hypothetical protein